MLFLELGHGWAPTVLDTIEEHDFIRQSQKGLSDAGDYFIAGSACPEHTGSFEYYIAPTLFGNRMPSYLIGQTGNVIFLFLSWIGGSKAYLTTADCVVLVHLSIYSVYEA